MPYAGKPLFEENFPPRWDTATQKYEVVADARFVLITGLEEASADWAGQFTAGGFDETNMPSYGVTCEADGASQNGLGFSALFPDQKDLIGSAVNVGVRMAGTAYVAAGGALQRGDYVTADGVGRAVKWTPASPFPKLGQVKEDAAIGSLVKIRYNGM